MTPLEWLGLEVAAEKLLSGNRGLGRMLVDLISADGEAVGRGRLMYNRVRHDDRPLSITAVRVRICILRAALKDVGLPNVIKSAPHAGAEPSLGYSLPEPGRSAVIARLIEEAETC